MLQPILALFGIVCVQIVMASILSVMNLLDYGVVLFIGMAPYLIAYLAMGYYAFVRKGR